MVTIAGSGATLGACVRAGWEVRILAWRHVGLKAPLMMPPSALNAPQFGCTLSKAQKASAVDASDRCARSGLAL